MAPFGAQAADIVGKARVVNGHTLDVAGVIVGLYGIQAPHPDQACQTRHGKAQSCGRLSMQSLFLMVRGPAVRCEPQRVTQDGRTEALCFTSWLNINEEMVLTGQALADPETGADFVRAQNFAKAREEGVWQTTFTVPWEWREE